MYQMEALDPHFSLSGETKVKAGSLQQSVTWELLLLR